jgi:hypothetical protein
MESNRDADQGCNSLRYRLLELQRPAGHFRGGCVWAKMGERWQRPAVEVVAASEEATTR